MDEGVQAFPEKRPPRWKDRDRPDPRGIDQRGSTREGGRRGRRFARPQADAAAHLFLAHGQLLVRPRHVALGVGVEVVDGGQPVLRAGLAQREVGQEGQEHRGQALRELVVVPPVIGEDAL
jgi:hypothetical protein